MSLGQVVDGITKGSDDAGDLAVVALVDDRIACDAAGARPFCTGVLVAPRVVLTAAHCVADRDPASLEVFVGGRVDATPSDGRFVLVTEIALHPAYAGPTRSDLALLRLIEDAGVAPVPLRRAPLSTSAAGAQARVVGFGQDAPTTASGVKRSGAIVVASVDADTLHATPGPSLTCLGDSGAPLLAVAGGVEIVIGVTTSGDPACRETSIFERVDVFAASFVDPFVARRGPDVATVTPARSADACGPACTSDAACGAGRVCQDDVSSTPGHVVRRCARSGLPEGALVAACKSRHDCGGDACVSVASGAGRGCFCYRPCDLATRCDPRAGLRGLGDVPCGAATPGATTFPGDLRGGCDLASALPSGGGVLGVALYVVVVVVVVARLRRRRRGAVRAAERCR